jgi:hypothetical protein
MQLPERLRSVYETIKSENSFEEMRYLEDFPYVKGTDALVHCLTTRKEFNQYLKREKKQDFDFFLSENYELVLTNLLKRINPKEKRDFYLSEKEGVQDIALIMMCKDEEDIIFENLSWHYAIGFRKFVILNNNSEDNTRKRLEEFKEKTKKDAIVYIIDDPIVEYIQSRKTTGAFNFAINVWPDLKWIFPVDADEFVCVTRSLREIVAEIPQNVDSMYLLKSRYHPELIVSGKTFYESNEYRESFDSVELTCKKVFLRSNPTFSIAQGNHSVISDGKIIYSAHPDIFMIEFQERSVDYTRKKVINMGKAFKANLDTSTADRVYSRKLPAINYAQWKYNEYQSYLRDGDNYIKALFLSVHKTDNKFLIHDPFPIRRALN